MSAPQLAAVISPPLTITTFRKAVQIRLQCQHQVGAGFGSGLPALAGGQATQSFPSVSLTGTQPPFRKLCSKNELCQAVSWMDCSFQCFLSYLVQYYTDQYYKLGVQQLRSLDPCSL